MSHHCHATNCNEKVSPEMFMCRDHWVSLPKVMKDEIWRTYRPGQCDDKSPSSDYCRAAKIAVTYIAKEEGFRPDTRLYDMYLNTEE